MANAKECDICKTLYRSHNGEVTKDILGYPASTLLFDSKYSAKYMTYDMCPDCAVKIANFIVSLKHKEETNE